MQQNSKNAKGVNTFARHCKCSEIYILKFRFSKKKKNQVTIFKYTFSTFTNSD